MVVTDLFAKCDLMGTGYHSAMCYHAGKLSDTFGQS